ncbi:hypothetical protein SLA2020_426070 [Shorea laevis]
MPGYSDEIAASFRRPVNHLVFLIRGHCLPPWRLGLFRKERRRNFGFKENGRMIRSSSSSHNPSSNAISLSCILQIGPYISISSIKSLQSGGAGQKCWNRNPLTNP